MPRKKDKPFLMVDKDRWVIHLGVSSPIVVDRPVLAGLFNTIALAGPGFLGEYSCKRIYKKKFVVELASVLRPQGFGLVHLRNKGNVTEFVVDPADFARIKDLCGSAQFLELPMYEVTKTGIGM